MAAAAGSPVYLEEATSSDAAADPEQHKKAEKHVADGQRAQAPLAYAKLPEEALLYSLAVAPLAAEALVAPGSSRLDSYSGSLAIAVAGRRAAGRPIAVVVVVVEQVAALLLRLNVDLSGTNIFQAALEEACSRQSLSEAESCPK